MPSLVPAMLTFYALAFGLAWIGWLPLLASARGLLPLGHPGFQVLLVLPATAPAVAAALTGRWWPREPGRGSLLRAFAPGRVGARWPALAVAIPCAVLLSARALDAWVPLGGAPDLPRGTASAVLELLVLSVLANPWEELGWRGFALPRLSEAGGPVAAALATGALAGLWHLPLFWWPGHPMAAFPWGAWFLGGMGSALVAAWLFFRTGGSLLVTSLFHVTLNVASLALGIRSFWTYAAALVPWVVILGWDLRGRKLPSGE